MEYSTEAEVYSVYDRDHQMAPTSESNPAEISDTSRDYYHDVIVYTSVAFMSIIIVVGGIGNTVVILAIQSSRKLQMVATNIFIVNLSICDLLFVTVVLPFNIYTYIHDRWDLDPTLCKFIGFLGYTLTGTTLMNISLIAWNRYKLVTDLSGYKNLFTDRSVSMMLVICWVLPVVCLLPALLEIWGKFEYVPIMVTCNLGINHDSQSFKLFLLIVRAVIPCCMIIYCYTVIHWISSRSHRKMTRTIKVSNVYSVRMHKQELHMTRMMYAIFLVFMLSYFPCTITSIIDWNAVLSKHFHMYCEITVYMGSAVNPLVYGFMNSQFREAYMKLLRCGRRNYGNCWWMVEKEPRLSTYKIQSLCPGRKSSLKIIAPSQSEPILGSSEVYYSSEDLDTDKGYEESIMVQIHETNRTDWEWMNTFSSRRYTMEKI